MRPDVLIAGQGLAGTLLAWEFERAGISFNLADQGHAEAATLAAAGLITPITGRRLVKSWRFEALQPVARAVYGELAAVLGVPLWHELRVRRVFGDEAERKRWQEKSRDPDLASFVESADDAGIWIKDAARVDLAALLIAARQRWLERGWLRSGAVDPERELGQYALVIDCTGEATATAPRWDFLPWEFSKGERLELAVDGLMPDVVLSRGHWIVPVAPGQAWVGATHQPGRRDRVPDAASRVVLESSVRALLGRDCSFSVTGHRAGVRVNLPDKRPLVGRHPNLPRLGLINGLGGKGALWAPMLAKQWVRHFTAGAGFDPEIDLRRFSLE